MELSEYVNDTFITRNLYYANLLKEGDIDPWKSIFRFYLSTRELQKIEKKFSVKSYLL